MFVSYTYSGTRFDSMHLRFDRHHSEAGWSQLWAGTRETTANVGLALGYTELHVSQFLTGLPLQQGRPAPDSLGAPQPLWLPPR